MAKKRKLENKAEPAEDPAPESTTQEPRDGEEPFSHEDPTEEEHISPEEPFEEEEEPINHESPAAADQIPESSDTPNPNPPHSASACSGVAGDEDEENDPASIQKILEPFPKDQLIEILRDAAVKYPDVLKEVNRIADVDPAHRKIFIHGLGWDTNVETLVAAFRQYGEIEDCKAVTDKATGKSKGYGFILFKHRSGASRALKQPQKKIGNRMTACQLASTGPVPPPAPPASEYTQRKIFVSNVGAELHPHKLMQFFSKFGEIEEGPLGLDKVTGRPKGFCLFVYKTVEGAKKSLEEPHKNFEGHILHCQKAIDGPRPNKPGFHLQVSGSQHAGLHHGSGQVGAHGSHFTRNENAGFIGGVGSHVPGEGASGHLMAPSAAGLGFNQGAQPATATAAAAAAAGLNPALGQALTAFLASQGAGLGLTNLLGTLGTPAVNQVVPSPMVNSGGHGMQGTYGNQVPAVSGNMNAGVMGGYVVQGPMQGGYGNAQIGQGGAGRNRQVLGHMGGVTHYMGH